MSLATKQDEHQGAQPDEDDEESIYMALEDDDDEEEEQRPTRRRNQLARPRTETMQNDLFWNMAMMVLASVFSMGFAAGFSMACLVLRLTQQKLMNSITSGTQTEGRQEEPVQAPAAAAAPAQPASTAATAAPSGAAWQLIQEHGVRRRTANTMMMTYPGHWQYPTAAFLQNEANLVQRPSLPSCAHPFLDRTGTNQHKLRYKCEECGGIWSGR